MLSLLYDGEIKMCKSTVISLDQIEARIYEQNIVVIWGVGKLGRSKVGLGKFGLGKVGRWGGKLGRSTTSKSE